LVRLKTSRNLLWERLRNVSMKMIIKGWKKHQRFPEKQTPKINQINQKPQPPFLISLPKTLSNLQLKNNNN
jgi:hypothetical protein